MPPQQQGHRQSQAARPQPQEPDQKHPLQERTVEGSG